jgi:DNA-directed RNA polymerase specialized sigma24 family protein
MMRSQGTAAAAGDDRLTAEDEVAMLIECHADALYRVALALTGSAVHASGVIRDVLLRALQDALPSRSLEALRLSLYRPTVHAALAVRSARRSNRTGPYEADTPQFAADGHRIEDGNPGDWSAFPEPDVAAAARAVLGEVVYDLPDALAVVVVLADGEGLSPAGIAEVTGLPIAAVRARTHQARMMLRERIGRKLAGSVAA